MTWPDIRAIFSRVLFVCACLLTGVAQLATTQALAQTVVVPNANETVEGSTNNCIPITGCISYVRYQQIHASSEFASLNAQEPVFITEIRFRAEGGGGFPNISFADIEIRLATAPAGISPATMSTTFANNLSDDVVTVFRGPLTFGASPSGPPGGPADFNLVIDLQTPFLYDPALGDLVFEWKNRSGELDFPGAADAVFSPTEPVARVYSSVGPDAPTSRFAPTRVGLVTQFSFVPVEVVSVVDAPTPIGIDVPVVNLPGFFEQTAAAVVQAGTTSANFCVAPDVRERTTASGRERFVRRFLALSEFSGLGTCTGPTIVDDPDSETWEELLAQIDLLIPPWYRAYKGEFTLPDDLSPTEDYWIVLAVVRTSAEYDGTLTVVNFPEGVIDYTNQPVAFTPGCDRDLEYRSLDLAGTVAAFNEFPNVEDKRMIVETAQCNRGRSLTRRTTHAYPLRLDTRVSFVGEFVNIARQFAGIQGTLNEASSCVDSTLIQSMQRSLRRAQRQYFRRRYARAEESLEQIARLAQDSSMGFMLCPIEANYRGNFIARGITAAFTIHDRFQNPDTFEKYFLPADILVPGLDNEGGAPPVP